MYLHFMQVAFCFLDLTEFIMENGSIFASANACIHSCSWADSFILSHEVQTWKGGRGKPVHYKRSTSTCSLDQYLHQSALNVCGSRAVHCFSLTYGID